jgi:hypothetical protein
MNNLPNGVSYSIANDETKENNAFTLSLIVTNQAYLGKYNMTLEASYGKLKKDIPFGLNINDTLSITMAIYDATAYSIDFPYGKHADSATIKLYTNESNFLLDKPYYVVNTDTDGQANFYHLQKGNYLFVVKKGNLSNIVDKKMDNGELKGFATCGIFQNSCEIRSSAQPNAQIGQLIYRDQNCDGTITNIDRIPYDKISIYNKSVVTKKLIWIGK